MNIEEYIETKCAEFAGREVEITIKIKAEPVVFTVKEAAKHYGRGTDTIRALYRDHAVPYFVDGRKIIKFKKADLDAWFNKIRKPVKSDEQIKAEAATIILRDKLK